MDASVQDVDGVEEGGGPESCVECCTVKERSNSAGDGFIPSLSAAVLLGTVGACGFDDIAMAFLHCGDKLMAASQFAALVASNDAAGGKAPDREEGGDIVNGRAFRFEEKDP